MGAGTITTMLVLTSLVLLCSGFHLFHKSRRYVSKLNAGNSFQRLHDMMNPLNAYLVGMMGSGKSSLAKIMSANLNYSCTDIDSLIQSEIGMPITQFFAQHGEARFRELETTTLSKVANIPRQIVATGGGLVLREENWQLMRRKGVVVFLNPSISTILDRLMTNPAELDKRPLLLNGQDPRQTLEGLMKKRHQYYSQADVRVSIEEGRSLHDVADSVAQQIVSYLTAKKTTDRN